MKTVITDKAVIEAARRGIERFGLDKRPDVAAALSTGHVGELILVKRLDEPERGYYLVTWGDEQGIRLIAEVDANTVELTSAVAAAQSQLMIDMTEARRLVLEKSSQEVLGEPQIVWHPCRESSSPYLPFYRFTTAEGMVFVRGDGALYTSLTPFGKGG